MGPTPLPGRPADGAGFEHVLAASGRVGADLLAVDWAATPVGPPDGWPLSLKTSVRTVLASRFSMWMAWGPDLTFFCNDAYRRDTLGHKYPWALGRPARQVWAEIWPDIGPRIDKVLSTGIATWDEGLMLFLERSGYVEETFHTFSYSPLAGDDDAINGMLCVVSEDTKRVIGERRLGTLRELGSELTSTRTERDVADAVVRVLGHNDRDFPFTLIYLLEPDGEARLAAATGFPDGHPAAPRVVLPGPDAVWPVEDLAAGEPVMLGDLASRFPELPTGAWEEPPHRALAVPLRQQGGDPSGFLVAGLNPYRAVDEDYRSFLDLVAGQLAAGVTAARANQAERERAEQLAELDRAKTQFFTNVSHEFRTPLTLMLAPLDDALTDTGTPLPDPHRSRVEVASRNARRLLQLVNTLLDFSRLESGRTTARFEPTDLPRYTSELASMFDSAVQRAGLHLGVRTTPLGQPVYVDREMWAKIVLNLLSNALKFTFDGEIIVSLNADGDAAVLAVTDSGIGIAEAEQARLFERFHRVSGTRSRSHEGSGIGLALVAELVALHGGTVGVRSVPGDGAVFTVRIPFGRDHLPADQVVPASEQLELPSPALDLVSEAMRWLGEDEAPAPGPAPGEQPLVLVADDNADMRGYVSGLLAGSYRVATAVDGHDALARAVEDPPDLVLTDVMMPNLDGFGLLRALREDPRTVGVPVIMLSARAGEEGVVEGLEAGADDFLTKPFTARELLARVRANLELDRVRRTRDELASSRALLDQAQRMAQVGSWQIRLADNALTGSEEYFRLMGVSPEEIQAGGLEVGMRSVHPDDVAMIDDALAAAAAGADFDVELRLVGDGWQRLVHARAELVRDADGNPTHLRGSLQDVTAQRQAERDAVEAVALRQVAEREHRIADELQRSLLPPRSFDPEHLQVATYYRAGVEGTQVGGDWYDVIELEAGRTALVIGDVMGRGVQAAAVMGQLRTVVRAYTRLGLPPGRTLEYCDAIVRDLGEDQIVTCLLAIYDPADQSLVYANAGHLPPLLTVHGEGLAVRLTDAAGPPLGSGPWAMTEQRVTLTTGATIALYTDGLVERRDSDLDTGISALAGRLAAVGRGALDDVPTELVDALLPDGPDDDIAVLLAHVPEE